MLPSDLPHQPPETMGHRRSSNSRHIPPSCSEKHAALGLSGIPSVSQTHLLHNHGWHKAKQHGLTARITLAKLRSLHAAAIQSPRTMAIRLRIIAILSHTSVSRVIHLGSALTDLSWSDWGGGAQTKTNAKRLRIEHTNFCHQAHSSLAKPDLCYSFENLALQDYKTTITEHLMMSQHR